MSWPNDHTLFGLMFPAVLILAIWSLSDCASAFKSAETQIKVACIHKTGNPECKR